MSKPKFTVGSIVSCSAGEGSVEEVCDEGKIQYRVRVDMSDHWVPESDVKLVRAADGDDPDTSTPAPSATATKKAATKKAAKKKAATPAPAPAPAPKAK